MQNIFQLAVAMCCCLQICNSVVNIVVMGLVLGNFPIHMYPLVFNLYGKNFNGTETPTRHACIKELASLLINSYGVSCEVFCKWNFL